MRRGSIVLDALLAAALAAAFAGALAISVSGIEDSVGRTAVKSAFLDAYTAHEGDAEGLLPGETRDIALDPDAGAHIHASARWYGNDRVETDISVGDASSSSSFSFRAIRAYPYPRIDDAAGTPLCDVYHGETLSITPIILPIDPSIPLTDLQVRDGVAYIAADSSRQSDPDLLVVDVGDARLPRVMSSIDTGPGLASLAIAGRYVFAAASSAAAQLHVVRMDNLSKLSLAARYVLPPPQASSSLPRATSVFYRGGIAYLGTEKWDGDELSLIDVSDPGSPRWLSGVEIGSKVDAISSRDGRMLYAAASSRSQFLGVDATDPSHPKVVWSLSPSGWQRQEGKTVVPFEGDLAFGRTSGGFDIAADPEVIFGTSTADVPGGVYGIAVDRDRIFAATRDIDRELTVFDRSLATTSARYYPLPVAPQAMACDGDRLYILGRDAPAIYEISFGP